MGLLERAFNLFKGKEENRPAEKPGRNDLCWCGSGIKYKKCHLAEDEKTAAKSCSINCGPT